MIPEMKAQGITVSEVWRAFGPDCCARSTVDAVLHGTYRSMKSRLAQEILAFAKGYICPDRFEWRS